MLFDPSQPAINGFFNEYRFLSNFWVCDVTITGISYKSTEAAFQAAKTLDLQVRLEQFSNATPKEAKHRGFKVKLRPSWDQVTKIEIMELCLRAKFNDPVLRKQLVNTGTKELIEFNNWGDTFWGRTNNGGDNNLGKLLMLIRKEYQRYA